MAGCAKARNLKRASIIAPSSHWAANHDHANAFLAKHCRETEFVTDRRFVVAMICAHEITGDIKIAWGKAQSLAHRLPLTAIRACFLVMLVGP